MINPPYIKSDLPEGRAGDWVLERFTVPDLTTQQQKMDTRPDWAKSDSGSYTHLRRHHETFMTDLYDEWCTQKIAMEEALQRGGTVLITGLGLGMIVESIFNTPGCAVTHITVIEKSADVIQLVAPHLAEKYGDRLHIIHADAFTWEPSPQAHFTVGWHDIWPNPFAPETEPDMQRLQRHYQNYCDWQGSWAREFQRMQRANTPVA